MSFITENGLGNFSQDRQKTMREALLETYGNVGRKVNPKTGEIIEEGMNWLEGINDDVQKANMALLYENQAAILKEYTDTASAGAFETIAFPMVRKIFGNLLANDIVSVQAISHPSATMYFFYPQISSRNTKVDGDDVAYKHPAYQARQLPECVGHNCPVEEYKGCKSLYDLYYNDGLYDHSKGEFRIVTATGEVIELTEEGCETGSTVGGQRIEKDGSLKRLKMRIPNFATSKRAQHITARLASGNRGLEYDTQEFLSSFTVIYLGATPLEDNYGNVILESGDVVGYRPLAQKYGQPLADSLSSYLDFCDPIQGSLPVELMFDTVARNCSDCTPEDGYTGIGSGSIVDINASDFVFTWREYKDLEASSEIGEVTFTLEKVVMSIRDRKLRARWTPELQADVDAYHNIDVEAELTNMMSEQVAMEIDREILLELKNGAAWRLHWDFYGWRNQGSQKYTEKEWKQTLITRINQISAQIHKSTLRGGANFLVVSSEASAIFDDLSMFAVSSNNIDDDKYNMGMQRIGRLAGRYEVYVDPYAKAHDILIGHKGSNLLDTGYIYAPYQPLRLTAAMTDFTNDTRVKGISTRYATHMVNNRFYGRIIIDNIPTFDVNELR